MTYSEAPEAIQSRIFVRSAAERLPMVGIASPQAVVLPVLAWAWHMLVMQDRPSLPEIL